MERRKGIIAVPFPIQGHINPMLRFCSSLAAATAGRGGAASIHVTLVLTHGVAKSVQSLSLPPLIHAFEFVSDGNDDGPPSTFEEYRSRLQASVSEGVAAVIGRRRSAAELLLYDSMMPWLAEIGRAGGLRVAALFTQSASVCEVYYRMLRGCSDLACSPDSRGLPEFSYFGDISEQVKSFIVNQASNMSMADWLLFNTFNDLEEEAVRWMSEKWAVKTIGPLVPRKTQRTPLFKQERIELYESDDEGCMAWLDKQRPNSVVYVSFGTVVVWPEEQMLEIATALVESDKPFLWAVRESEESKLPSGLLDPNEKGLLVRWCPQAEVLSHDSVACFVTHCGWNSVLEAVCSGVPVVGMPQIVDQPANARLVEDVWRVGVRVKVGDEEEKGIVTREEIKGCVARVTGGDEFRRNAMKWKALAEGALAEGGSSHANIRDFVSQLDSRPSRSSSS
ncbi:unnamed protein product [Cuscuta campestris]|uniref:Glycosyltransferase n=1 Tax=Cuscuta campestris TaxID=132261 RepID=A0A484L8G3_9ASTE|nr:unnamed protein product [Cuscuta campestris]